MLRRLSSVMVYPCTVSDWTKVVAAQTMAEERDVPLEPGDVLTLIWVPSNTLNSECAYLFTTCPV